MISSEIGVKIEYIYRKPNISRARSKLREQFVVCKSCCYLVIKYMKKTSLKGKANEILTACALFKIGIHVPALRQCYMTNALGFSQSETHKFFVYIFSKGNNIISSAI